MARVAGLGGVKSKVEGLKKVVKNLTAYHDKLGKLVSAGMREAGMFLMSESMDIVPVWLSPLRGSADIRVEGTGFKTDVIVGYFGTKYAVYVHEDPLALHGKEFNLAHAEDFAKAVTPAQKKRFRPRGPNQQFKFLERPMREKRDDMLRIIEDTVEGGLG